MRFMIVDLLMLFILATFALGSPVAVPKEHAAGHVNTRGHKLANQAPAVAVPDAGEAFALSPADSVGTTQKKLSGWTDLLRNIVRGGPAADSNTDSNNRMRRRRRALHP